MVKRYTKAKGRKMAKKSKMAKKRAYAKSQGQIATVKQTVSLLSGKQRNNAIYTAYNFSLATSTRAIKVAEAYQEYRITKLVFKFKPQQDTFSGAASGSIPYLHALIDRVGSLRNAPNLNFRSLRETGCMIRRFDDKNVTIAYKPAVLVASTSDNYTPTANAFSSYKISPWLNTNSQTLASGAWAPNNVDHGGLVYGVEQDLSAAGVTIPFDVDIDVYYQFRKPRTMTAGIGPVNGVVAIDFNEGGADLQT